MRVTEKNNEPVNSIKRSSKLVSVAPLRRPAVCVITPSSRLSIHGLIGFFLSGAGAGALHGAET